MYVFMAQSIFFKAILLFVYPVSRRQSFKRNLVLKKKNLVLNFLVVHYLNSDCNNTVR